MSQLRAAKQLLAKCHRCNRSQSVVWTKCPHCTYEQAYSQNTIVRRLMQTKAFKQLKWKSDSDSDKNDELVETEQNKLSLKNCEGRLSPVKNHMNSLQKMSKKRMGSQKLVQNNSETNYKIDGSIGKYLVMLVLIFIFFGFLFYDINTLKRAQASETIHEINQCEQTYDKNDCEIILNDSARAQYIKEYCIKQKICKERDPFADIKMLKIIVLYFTEITHESLNNMNSKVTGFILIIYFFGLAFSHFLNCICPKRNHD